MHYSFLSRVRKFFYYAVADLLTPFENNSKQWERKNRWLRLSGINIKNDVAIDEKFFVLSGMERNLVINDHTVIGINFQAFPFNTIEIGRFCMFGANVELTNGGHDTNTLKPFSKPLIIGNGCWIGHGVKIIKGVVIGNNVIIGGGSVVIDDIPDNAVVAGVPAKVIKYRDLPKNVWHLGNTYFCPGTFELTKGENE